MGEITAIVHTKNSAATLAKTLKSLSFVDELLVVDMQSQDETLTIAQKHHAQISTFKDVGFVEPARNYALGLATKDWVLIVDADEEVTPDLKLELERLAAQDSETVAYYIPRKNLIFEQWIEHSGWWPDYQLRFFKRGSVTWPETIHAQPVITGRTQELEPTEALALIHHNYQSIEQYLDRLNRYTSISAQSTGGDKNLSPTEVWQTFTHQFLSRYFAQDGWQDGTHGMGLSLLQGMYETAIQLKVWQKQNFPAKKTSPAQQIKVFREFQKELNYWLADWQVQRSSGLTRIWWQVRRKWKL